MTTTTTMMIMIMMTAPNAKQTGPLYPLQTDHVVLMGYQGRIPSW